MNLESLLSFIRSHGFACRVLPSGDIRIRIPVAGSPEDKIIDVTPAFAAVRDALGY